MCELSPLNFLVLEFFLGGSIHVFEFYLEDQSMVWSFSLEDQSTSDICLTCSDSLERPVLELFPFARGVSLLHPGRFLHTFNSYTIHKKINELQTTIPQKYALTYQPFDLHIKWNIHPL